MRLLGYSVGDTLGVGEFFKVKRGVREANGEPVALKFGKYRVDRSICKNQAENEVVRRSVWRRSGERGGSF
jgi:hypothetical protein